MRLYSIPAWALHLRRHITLVAFALTGGGCVGGSSYGALLLQSLLSLTAVLMLLLAVAKLSRRWLAPARGSGRLEVLERKWVSQRSTLVVVRAGTKVLLLSEGIHGMRTLAELPAEEWSSETFGELLGHTPDGPAELAESASTIQDPSASTDVSSLREVA